MGFADVVIKMIRFLAMLLLGSVEVKGYELPAIVDHSGPGIAAVAVIAVVRAGEDCRVQAIDVGICLQSIICEYRC